MSYCNTIQAHYRDKNVERIQRQLKISEYPLSCLSLRNVLDSDIVNRKATEEYWLLLCDMVHYMLEVCLKGCIWSATIVKTTMSFKWFYQAQTLPFRTFFTPLYYHQHLIYKAFLSTDNCTYNCMKEENRCSNNVLSEWCIFLIW